MHIINCLYYLLHNPDVAYYYFSFSLWFLRNCFLLNNLSDSTKVHYLIIQATNARFTRLIEKTLTSIKNWICLIENIKQFLALNFLNIIYTYPRVHENKTTLNCKKEAYKTIHRTSNQSARYQTSSWNVVHRPLSSSNSSAYTEVVQNRKNKSQSTVQRAIVGEVEFSLFSGKQP